MTRQIPEAATALWTRLQGVFDDIPRTTRIETPPGQANWPAGFGHDIPDVKTVVIHFTAGWPTRSKWDEFVDRYTNPAHPAASRGIGPHYYMSYDGSVFRLLSENRQCWHASHVNDRAIGVETGNLSDGRVGAATWVCPPPTGPVAPWPGGWTALTASAHDLPGAKFWAKSVNNEILVCLWTAGATASPDSQPSTGLMMLPSEAQYRSWALLGRWLAEVWRVPRDFPIRPHLMRQNTWQAARWLTFRQVVDADPIRDPYLRTQMNTTSALFESNIPATGLPHIYAAGVQMHPKPQNNHWTHLFNSYRGFHGHGYSGANVHDDHNCPGPWFDWHRFARDVWDYWWYPFDLAQAAPGGPVTSGLPRRDYGRTDGVLYEHYFDEEPSLFAKVTTSGFYPIGDETVAPHPMPGPPQGFIGMLYRMYRRYWGFWHGGMHFQLASGSPIYAMAPGQLVAARLGNLPSDENAFHRNDPASANPTTLFVLLRHEVFFQRAAADRIDYNQEPARVYTLYMHLGVPSGLSFTDVADDNPTWLNRAISMKKEYDLGSAFQAAHPNPPAQWAGHTARWARRRASIDPVLTDLQAGRIARFPEGEDAIRVALGDFLGVAGHLDTNAFGVHVEVFSRDALNDPWFESVDQGGAASRPFHDEKNLDDVTSFIENHVTAPPRGTGPEDVYRDLPAEQKATRFQTIALRSKSEWALTQSDFPDGGWAPVQELMWWSTVVPGMNAALAGDAAAQLPADAVVWHYHPLGFMAWLNVITWRSEWSKYRVTDAAGAPAPVPARPPPRR